MQEVEVEPGGVNTVWGSGSVLALYRIVNKTGLLIWFKQKGDKVEAVGQYKKHEPSSHYKRL